MDYKGVKECDVRVYIVVQLLCDYFYCIFVVGDNKMYDGYYNVFLELCCDYFIWYGVYMILDGVRIFFFFFIIF